MPSRQRGVEVLEFSPERTEGVVSFMERLLAAGEGWINLLAERGEEEETRLGYFTLFGGGGIAATMCTFVPAAPGAKEGASLGITHGAGRRVISLLEENEHPVPPGWFVEQDHPRRGLVLRLPVGASLDAVLDWALRALCLLGPGPSAGRFRAEVHLPLGP